MSAFSAISGRAASIERRRALSAGKSALPPAAERVRSGERTASVATSTSPLAAREVGGRAASIARRRALSVGKSALPPAAERVRNGERSAALPVSSSAVSTAPPAAATAVAPTPGVKHSAAEPCAADCCDNPARARRAMQSIRGRGNAAAAPPSRPAREGRLQYAPKVVSSTTQGRQTVTGSRIGNGSQVTGGEPGANLPVSGTQYIGREAGLAAVPVGPKVGLSRTVGGGIVTGTQIRSKIAITGDEAGSNIAITGESEQRPDDDLTERRESGGHASAQFQRQAEPHGHTVFGTNLGRSLRQAGSRARERTAALETTERGLAITGSAIGRATRMTGDEDGACRTVTGDQYLSPAKAQAECGGAGGGTAAPAAMGMVRRDPVTGGKVGVATTWAEQRITGTDVEHDPRVTGDMQGSCSVVTGTHYHGPRTLHAWCDPAVGEAAQRQVPRKPATTAVTGDTPLHDGSVTGTHRGATRDITGTRYFFNAEATPPSEDAVAAINEKFSVTSPQRAAQLRADRAAVDAPSAAGRITGAFAIEPKKLTGNLEFTFRPRHATEPGAKPARTRISGEGRTAGQQISGASWGDQSNVTGSESFTAVERNPSERNGKPHAFAGANQFKSKAVKEDPKQLVTGMFGWSSSSSAKVTLSGGAHG